MKNIFILIFVCISMIGCLCEQETEEDSDEKIETTSIIDEESDEQEEAPPCKIQMNECDGDGRPTQ